LLIADCGLRIADCGLLIADCGLLNRSSSCASPTISIQQIAMVNKGTRVAHWLLKTEPDCYAWNDLARDKRTVWDGVANATALKHIRSMKKGDSALFYHTGGERAVVGLAEIASDPYPDPKEDDERLAVVDLKLKKQLPRPVTLDQIKADKTFAGWELLRIGRLSVVPVPKPMWDRLINMAKEHT
jgi:predicted RNA-binding protein with PUA-like domain